MGVEIERKFLILSDAYKQGITGKVYRQGYLNSEKERIVRVRIVGDEGFLTIKGLSKGIQRTEFEYAIPLNDAGHMLENLCLQPIIEKTRYLIPYEGHVWEVDEFHGENQGLVVAEIEFSSKNEHFSKPPWVGEDVSHDWRYFNSNLSIHPYTSWED
ncbi:MAG: CYTH domain-containing protein [Candidatus Marinimicrobia bacterium]|nr:CYTH domain-containing protein [FCB group bacterium]MBL7026475.1 CYTH domain-containing protein [Candidatus Neomarinimicrobiota bacterium]